MSTEEFKAKILPHYRYMYRIAASVMRSDSEAADVVQDAMLRLYERRQKLDKVEDIRSYCVYVVRNACLNIIRSRKEYISTEEISNIDSSQNIHKILEWKDMSGRVGKAMNRLPEDQRNVSN